MALDHRLRQNLTLPAICAPMFLVSGPQLVTEACKAGIVGALPRQNARGIEVFDAWLRAIREELDVYSETNPTARVGPLAVNLATFLDEDELAENLGVCERYGVEIIISATGNPATLARRVHDMGRVIFHDVTTIRFAEKAIAAGVDGLTCIGAGGGGHSGTISHLVLIPKIRSMFDGVIVMAGAVSNGAVIRAAEILGADLSYLGTRFIATRESMAADEYKAMILRASSTDLLYTPDIAGVGANWMTESMTTVGLDPSALPKPAVAGKINHTHLPDGVKPWKNLWSAGQGIDLIDDIPTVAELVARLRREYVAACRTPDMADVARLVDEALA
ncbi:MULTISPECIES: NAD(P)H-dependent flavin oxidoreductase [Mycobacterium]|uniref:2-nitropropane dioxygenase n=1 Tax=Mycobacterium paraseoulense TaxID=590652 RepID=A0A1X0IF58_9MYCO|nr:nitronate monooxygenase [Mycobacterium paraseoulense]MCV7393726.1 nitronate monooxygenase [Mycobacterium paraseoulense]ORB45525.1 2-nitropropane dioxygenase [Mycobacterium paraseoulense]BBZ70656.1 2-nitropropane dioxygenase [Mycobacterium paraseoulense]